MNKPCDAAAGAANPTTVDAVRGQPADAGKSVTPEVIAVPGLFWADHADRAPLNPGEQLATPVGTRGHSVLLRADDPGLKVLLEDAIYYANAENMDNCPANVRASAQRTVAALKRRA